MFQKEGQPVWGRVQGVFKNPKEIRAASLKSADAAVSPMSKGPWHRASATAGGCGLCPNKAGVHDAHGLGWQNDMDFFKTIGYYKS